MSTQANPTKSTDRTTRVEPVTCGIGDAVAISGLGRSTIYLLLDCGVIRSYKVGRRRLVDYTSLVGYLTAESAEVTK